MIGMLTGVMTASGEDGEFHPPSISEFFPGELLFAGTPFAMTRINLIGLLMTGLISLFFVVAFSRRNRLVPTGSQNVAEWLIGLVHHEVIDEVMGEKGKKYAPYLISMFFLLLAFNFSGILPTMHIAVTSVIGVPLLLAATSWLVFKMVSQAKAADDHHGTVIR